MAVKSKKKREELADQKRAYVNGQVYLEFERSNPAGSKLLIEVLERFVSERGDSILKAETEEYEQQAALLKDSLRKAGTDG